MDSNGAGHVIPDGINTQEKESEAGLHGLRKTYRERNFHSFLFGTKFDCTTISNEKCR